MGADWKVERKGFMAGRRLSALVSQAADTLHLLLHFAQLAEFPAEFLFLSTAIHNYSQTAFDRLVCLGVTGYLPILHKNDHLWKATSQRHSAL